MIPTRSGDIELMPTGETALEPGSWWMLRPDAEIDGLTSGETGAARIEAAALREKMMTGPGPDHGLLLMVTEVRLVDDLPHTVILHPHSLWQRQEPAKVLAGPFLAMMRYEPDGLHMRAAEEGALMGRIRLITEEMAQPPSPGEVAQIVDRLRGEREEKARREAEAAARRGKPAAGIDSGAMAIVPAALLPSRDLARAERVIQDQILTAEATKEIMNRSMKAMQAGMEIVGRFQQEKVAVAIAGVSRQTEYARSMMGKVHTMKLWLGEGVGIRPLVGGRGAAPEEPIRFMQQLLYLDEEIFSDRLSGTGFSSDDMRSLGQMLEEDRSLVERMLPHDRCVAITRVRRHNRHFEVPGDWAAIFSVIDRMEQDKRIQILIRDGERITMVTADEETSNARRLFPSRAEIDAIFTSTRGGQRHEVDVDHVDYTDSRRAHEDRALFYKRFLLILWGAHEREGVFGAMPAGMNWLSRETHDRFFDFVHDEEMGIDDGRQPVLAWIRNQNLGLRPGSMAVATWEHLVNSDTAPGAWSNHVHRQQEQVRRPVYRCEVVEIQRRGEEIFAMGEFRKLWDEPVGKVKVRLSERAGGPDLARVDGLINIDHMRSADMLAYIGSRRHRESYLRWLGEFRLALPKVREREVLEAALSERLLARLGDSPDLAVIRDAVPAVAHEAVLAARWQIPKESHDARLIEQARAMTGRLPDLPEGALQVSLRPGGDLVALYPAPELLGDVPEPFLVSRVFAIRSGKRPHPRQEQVIPFSPVPEPGEIMLSSRIDDEQVRSAWKNADRGISCLADRRLVDTLLSAHGAASIAADLDGLLRCDAAAVAAELDGILGAHAGRSKVGTLTRWRPLAVYTAPGRNGTIPGLAGYDVHPVYHAWCRGHRDLVVRFLHRLYAEPERQVARYQRFEAEGRSPIRTWAIEKWGNQSLSARIDGFSAGQGPTILKDDDITWRRPDGEQARIPAPGTSLRDRIRRVLIDRDVGNSWSGISDEAVARIVEQSDTVRLLVGEGLEERLEALIAAAAPMGRENGPIYDI